MWGDEQHIKRLKEEQPPWPSDFPDPKKTKKQERQQAKADRAAQKAAVAEARKLAKWSQMPTTTKAKKPPTAMRPSAADLADLKAAEWQAKQEARDAKAHQQALKATIRAEKAAAKAAHALADEEARWLREMAATKKGNNYSAYVEPITYAPAALPTSVGCLPTAWLLLILAVALVGLYVCLCNCG